MDEPNYWIGVASQVDVDQAIAGGYAELGRGRAGPLERMRKGDGLALYSPRIEYPHGPPLQAFTGLCRIRDGIVYQAALAPPAPALPAPAVPALALPAPDLPALAASAPPFRLAVDYLPATPAAIRPLIETLSFIRNKTHWGAAFRFGIVRVGSADFAIVAAAMGRDFAADFPARATFPMADLAVL